jgi:uncharacterized membrane protein
VNRWLLASIVLTTAALAACLTLYFGYYDRLPAEIPVHWGVSGAPDRFVPRDQALLSLLTPALVMLGTLALGRLLPWLLPQPFSIESFRATYEYLMFLLIVFFAWMQGLMLLAAFQPTVDLGRWVIAGAYLLFAFLGNVLGKVQRNFFVGVRTPWTLANETVWTQTHRLAAWLFVTGGAIGFVATALGILSPWLLVGVIAVIAGVPVIYSLVLFKQLERQGRA